MTKYPERIESWRTSDGRIHVNEHNARWWQGQIESAAALTASLESGTDLASACAAVGWFQRLAEEDRRVLAQVTCETRLVIEHWQCRNQPGYRVVRANPDGTFFVHGHAGSWAGPYGADISLSDLIRYARDTFKRFTVDDQHRCYLNGCGRPVRPAGGICEMHERILAERSRRGCYEEMHGVCPHCGAQPYAACRAEPTNESYFPSTGLGEPKNRQ